MSAIPFASLAAIATYDGKGRLSIITSDVAAKANVAYGASILSFLGGMHWSLAAVKHGVNEGNARALNARYAWSVVPALVAWPALMMPERAACATIGAGLIACAAADTAWSAKGAFPRWMLPLRYALTGVGVASLAATAMRQRRGDDGDR